jgi:multiple sugar transport system substrate-binding protein
MDRLLTLEGGIGCRRTTWLDAEVNRRIPFYRDMEALHANARVMPRLREWPKVTSFVDQMVLAALNTSEGVATIAARAQAEVDSLFSRTV